MRWQHYSQIHCIIMWYFHEQSNFNIRTKSAFRSTIRSLWALMLSVLILFLLPVPGAGGNIVNPLCLAGATSLLPQCVLFVVAFNIKSRRVTSRFVKKPLFSAESWKIVLHLICGTVKAPDVSVEPHSQQHKELQFCLALQANKKALQKRLTYSLGLYI